jgi:5-methylcytosine-specific restriction protein A
MLLGVLFWARGAMVEYHHLYNRAAWRKLRLWQLSQSPLCRMHQQLGQVVQANVVDHITPHRGDLELFFERTNLQSLCKPCHDRHKQAQEHSPDGLLRGAGHDGRPIDLAHPWHKPVMMDDGRGDKNPPKRNH